MTPRFYLELSRFLTVATFGRTTPRFPSLLVWYWWKHDASTSQAPWWFLSHHSSLIAVGGSPALQWRTPHAPCGWFGFSFRLFRHACTTHVPTYYCIEVPFWGVRKCRKLCARKNRFLMHQLNGRLPMKQLIVFPLLRRASPQKRFN